MSGIDWERVTSQDICFLLQIGERQLERLVKEGLPQIRAGRRRFYNAPEVIAWRIRQAVDKELMAAFAAENPD